MFSTVSFIWEIIGTYSSSVVNISIAATVVVDVRLLNSIGTGVSQVSPTSRILSAVIDSVGPLRVPSGPSSNGSATLTR
ncbi:MAG: hypothetical protein R2741_09780 [Methanolobus sp.]